MKLFYFLLAHFKSFLNHYLSLKFINKCQKEILRCVPPSSHVCVCDFCISNDLTQMVNFLTRIPDCHFHNPALSIYFYLLTLVLVLQWLSLHFDYVVVSVFIEQFPQNQNGIPRFIVQLITIFVLIGMVFVIIWELFHGKISLGSVLLLLLINFVHGFRLELMYIFVIVSISSCLSHLHGF